MLTLCQFLGDGRLFVIFAGVLDITLHPNMLISIIIGFIIAFVLGKKTVKNIKEYGRRKENGDSSAGTEEGKED